MEDTEMIDIKLYIETASIGEVNAILKWATARRMELEKAGAIQSMLWEAF